jgi:hypothetical protein
MAMRVWAMVLGVLLAACAPLEPGTPVGVDEIQRELVGKTWQVKVPNGAPATEQFHKDGRVVINGGLNDVGTWRFSEDGYCTAWQRIRHGDERCFTVDRTPSGHYRVYKPTGELSMTILSYH